MLRNTHQGALDMGRIANAVSTPGIDPRVWVSLAIVTDVCVDDEGVFVDVILMPSGKEETARVGSPYQGPGFGLYLPLEANDEVVVEAPSGDPDMGLVVSERLWSKGNGGPPQDAMERPLDGILLMKPGRTLRLVTMGAGNLVINPRGTGKVMLGGETGLQPAVLGNDLLERLEKLENAHNTHTHQVPGVESGLSAATAIVTTATTDQSPAILAEKVVLR